MKNNEKLINELNNAVTAENWKIDIVEDNVRNEKTPFLYNRKNKDYLLLIQLSYGKNNKYDLTLFENNKVIVTWYNRTIKQIIEMINSMCITN